MLLHVLMFFVVFAVCFGILVFVCSVISSHYVALAGLELCRSVRPQTGNDPPVCVS